MKLFTAPLSLYGRKVEIALREKTLTYEREMVPFTQEGGYAPKHPAVLAVNPKGQVPVLYDGDLALFDSTVILEYLEDAYPEPALYPSDPTERAQCRLLELYADEILSGEVRRLMYRTEAPDPDRQTRARRTEEGRRAETAIRAHYRSLEARLSGKPFFCGDFSVADIALFVAVLYARRLGGPGPEESPALAAWYARVGARPAAAEIAGEIAAADRALSPPLSP
ncbi:MAG TPA: glutathione S-transferase family protein [Acetobacteraceae bacterium]|nr:glutathione S-transferase family protein [Acetobacteraceae bacterium]